MRFSDLAKLEYFRRDALEDELRRRLPGTPIDVIRGVYIDHGQKSEFQEQYSALEIDRIRWQETQVSGRLLTECSYYEGFMGHVTLLESSVREPDEEIWHWLTDDPKRADYWRTYQTWITPPFFLHGSLLGKQSPYHLVEGHTRMRVLRGAHAQGVISPDKQHTIWLGSG